VPAAFTATESSDVGINLGSPVSEAYEERRRFPFTGKIAEMDVTLVK
jgi:arylsulfatase